MKAVRQDLVACMGLRYIFLTTNRIRYRKHVSYQTAIQSDRAFFAEISTNKKNDLTISSDFTIISINSIQNFTTSEGGFESIVLLTVSRSDHLPPYVQLVFLMKIK